MALLGVSVIASLRNPPSALQTPATRQRVQTGMWIGAATWISLLVFMSKMGSESAARLIAPYYIPLIASLLLLPGMAALTRRRWWKIWAAIAALAALPLVILNPSRPLWPALTFLQKATALYPGNPLAARAQTVYSTYRNRGDSLAPLRQFLSSGDQVVGFIGADDSEIALWRPFGERKVVEVMPSTLAQFSSAQWLVFTREEGVQTLFHQSMEEWIKATGAEVVGKKGVRQKASVGEQDWFVLKIKKGSVPADH
jgi:hypothetical protein